MQADAVSALVHNHKCIATVGPTSNPIVDKPNCSATANVDLAATASAALAAVNQLRSNTSPDQSSDIMAALTRKCEGDDTNKCSAVSHLDLIHVSSLLLLPFVLFCSFFVLFVLFVLFVSFVFVFFVLFLFFSNPKSMLS